ncbi:chemotaxis response regulator protein-glutamate methylesterase [candidate division KSB3 bacterium]|uniref:Protein-glutamate methylesterase/protein-glutamine glutaminase n=1 Tax=candidate division KSB3 bacterium TaxID=2044937 RepID=A0A2G6K786_9BACT|nr:MAG: chemotaxis response regulator protein-glutamate methylesterase [candidate division KSB3 bacterium]
MTHFSASPQKVRVFIVDDSAFARRTLTKILERDPRIDVIGTAWDGMEAIEKIDALSPDVVTMDINMPHMNGIEALDVIMREMPLPVILVSSLDQHIVEETLEGLERGAVDFILKPTELASEKLYQIQTELVNKVVTISSLKSTTLRKTLQTVVPKAPPPPLPPRRSLPQVPSSRIACVAIGVSTGGPTALYHIIPRLPANFPAGIIIVQHMPPGFTKPLADRMNKNSNIVVKEAESGDEVIPGLALVAPGGRHLFLRHDDQQKVVVHIDPEPSHYIHIPSVDLTFSDAAEIYRKRCLGIILTGMGKDGVKGLEKIKSYGGYSIAEDESTCVVFGMPEVAIRRGLVDTVAPVHHIAEILMDML